MTLEQMIADVLGVEIHISHRFDGKCNLHINEVLYDGTNWEQRECRDSWLAEDNNRLTFANPILAVRYFLSWFLQNRLGLERDPISGSYQFGPMKQVEPKIPFTNMTKRTRMRRKYPMFDWNLELIQTEV